ncbi:MAG: M20/M25/M40 family metallo-hydrolase [Cyclobacteriaceae bacterium]
MRKILFFGTLLLFGTALVQGQSLSKSEMASYAQGYFPEALQEYREFLAIPNNGKIPEHRDQNVQWCLARFEALGFQTQTLVSEGIPHIFAERSVAPEAKTILFYMQIDGQPVDSSEWFQDSPYEPVLKKKVADQWQIVGWDQLENGFDPDLRVFARSASDSKGPSMALISALQILQDHSMVPPYNLKVIMDFQEEWGSPALPPLVKSKPELFSADMMIIMDGTRHLSNLPTLAFGARGIATITLTAFGSTRNLHSGQYGNFAPNPTFGLARLLGGMKDESGRVAIPGFYEGVNISEADRVAFASVPEDKEDIERSLGIAEAEQVGASYQESMAYPSLNIRGMKAAWVGDEVRTIIPSEAIAEIDMRLVPETDGLRQVNLVKQYILDQGYHLVDSLPTEQERAQYSKLLNFDYDVGSQPFRSDMNSELGLWLEKSMQRAFGDQYVKIRTTGGSQPIAPFISILGIPAVSARIPNPDNNIHAPNENLRLGNFLEGIQTCLAILSQPID